MKEERLAAPVGGAPVRWSDTLPRKTNDAERERPDKRTGRSDVEPAGDRDEIGSARRP